MLTKTQRNVATTQSAPTAAMHVETAVLHGSYRYDPTTLATTVPIYLSNAYAFEAALATSSGQAAIMLAILNIAVAGDNIVSSTHLYGGTINLLSIPFKGSGSKLVSSIRAILNVSAKPQTTVRVVGLPASVCTKLSRTIRR